MYELDLTDRIDWGQVDVEEGVMDEIEVILSFDATWDKGEPREEYHPGSPAGWEMKQYEIKIYGDIQGATMTQMMKLNKEAERQAHEYFTHELPNISYDDLK